MIKERLERLKEIKDILKSEFIGIDSIIDDICQAITPWYVTPELIQRPVVISIWGLTGTGKTSVVRRLTELLDLQDKTLFFDCGCSEGTLYDVTDKINDFFEEVGGKATSSSDLPAESPELRTVFVFDEFQYTRTIDEDGRELSKTSQRGIWSLMDSGYLDIVSRPWESRDLISFTNELDGLLEDFGEDLAVSDGCWPDTKEVRKKLSETIDIFKNWDELEEDRKSDGKSSLYILSKNKKNYLITLLNNLERGLGYKRFQEIQAAKTLGEVVGLMKKSVKAISCPRRIDCSKSLVFAIGNLDEAFSGVSDLDPDMDADVFWKIIKKTGVTDIKEALKSRFRMEQVGRLGNNMIIYPSLKKADFRELIKRELTRSAAEFKKTSGITVTWTEGFIDLLYSEGVIPSQGTRPVFATVGTICTSKFSRILSEPDHGDEVELDIDGNLWSEQINVILRMKDKEVVIPEKLNMGRLRSSWACKKLAAHAIHEAGHAVVMTLTKKTVPEMILAQSSLGGGYTYDAIKDTDRLSAQSKAEVSSEVKIALAGNAAEHEFFDDSHCTTGCTRDWQDAWRILSDAAYKGSFFGDPWPWFHVGCPDGTPDGIPEKEVVVDTRIKDYLSQAFTETKELVRSERNLIRHLALALVKDRVMFPDQYRSIVHEYGTNQIVSAMDGDNTDYWLDKIKEED